MLQASIDQDPDHGNLILSPLSMQAALTLMMEGARGETQNQMAQILGFEPRDGTLQRLMKLIYRANDGLVELLIANHIFARKTFRVSPDFQTRASDYDAAVENVDFNQR